MRGFEPCGTFVDDDDFAAPAQQFAGRHQADNTAAYDQYIGFCAHENQPVGMQTLCYHAESGCRRQIVSCALRADSNRISGMRNRSSCYGMTLIELLLVVSVVAILLANALPSFRETIMDSRRTAAINELVGTIQFARGEAAKRNREVVLCPSGGGRQCTADPWNLGWLVFANLDKDSPARLDAGEPLLYVKPARDGLEITANRLAFRFRPLGVRSVNGTITFCDSRGAQYARAVIISYTGRPRVSARDASNQRLQCR